jgi:clan AA aspartic protease (TIGR02281 family)
MLIISYHPDAATEHIETQLLNKQEGLLQQGEAYLNELKHASLLQDNRIPSGETKPSVRLAQTAEHLIPVPDAVTDAFPVAASPAPTPQEAASSTFKASGGPGWFQNLKRSLSWKKPSSGSNALPSLVDKPVVSVSISPASSSAARKTSFTTVPMSFEPKALFVKVNVNDRSSGHFILDTGATYTTISRKMAEELGLDLRHSETISITTANGELKVPKVRLKSVKVNNIEASDVEATVMDFENNASFSGLLGLSFIQHFKLTLDPQNGQMRFEPLR